MNPSNQTAASGADNETSQGTQLTPEPQWVAATPLQRLLAFVINRLLWLLPLLPVILASINSGTISSYARVKSGESSLLVWLISALLCLVLLIIQTISMAKKGQSIGKKIMGIKVVSSTGEKAGMGQVVMMRYVFSFCILFFWLDKMQDYMGTILLFWYLALFLSWCASAKQSLPQTWQDKISQTMVVQVNPSLAKEANTIRPDGQ